MVPKKMYFLTYLLKERKLSGETAVKLSCEWWTRLVGYVLGDEEDRARTSQQYSMWGKSDTEKTQMTSFG